MGDHRPLLRPPRGVERVLGVAYPGEVLAVDEPDDLDRVTERGTAEPRPRFAPMADNVRGGQCVVQPREVHRAQLAEGRVVLALGVGVLPVALVHVEPAAVQAEAHPASAEQALTLVVLGLPLQPARGHGGHRCVRVEVANDVLDARPSLRPEKRDGTGHAAYTWMVRPTSSSIP